MAVWFQAKSIHHRSDFLSQSMAGEDVEIVQPFSYLAAIKHSPNDMAAANMHWCGYYKNLRSALKIEDYQIILRPVVLFESKTWTLIQANEQMLSVWILRTIFGPVRDDKAWRSRYKHELYNVYVSPSIVPVAKSKVEHFWPNHIQENIPGKRIVL